MISKQQRDKSHACFVERWDVIPEQNAKWQESITKMLDSLTPSWISFSGNIYVLPSTFDQHVILKIFEGQYSQWHPPSPTPLVSCSPTFRLNSCHSWNCSLEMGEDPTMTSHLLSGLYHLENSGCMGFVGVKQNSRIWQMLVDKLTWQRNVPSWQRHLSNWFYRETWLYHIIKGSHRRSHLLIQLSSLFWNPWQNLQSFLSS